MMQTDKRELLLSYTDDQFNRYAETNLRAALEYAPERFPAEHLPELARKHPRAFLMGNPNLLQTCNRELFDTAVVKQPTAALLYAWRWLTPTQIFYCMNNVPSVIFRALAENDTSVEDFRNLPLDFRLFWYCVQTAPEQAVINVPHILASTRVDTVQASSDTPPNGYTMWTVMDTQKNPHNLPRVTMMDEIVIFAVASPVSTLARIIRTSVDWTVLTPDQWLLINQRVK